MRGLHVHFRPFDFHAAILATSLCTLQYTVTYTVLAATWTWQHLSFDDCLEVGRENSRNYSVLCRVGRKTLIQSIQLNVAELFAPWIFLSLEWVNRCFFTAQQCRSLLKGIERHHPLTWFFPVEEILLPLCRLSKPIPLKTTVKDRVIYLFYFVSLFVLLPVPQIQTFCQLPVWYN